MVKIIQDMSGLEITLACGGLLFAMLLTGWVTDMLLGKTGLGVFLNGLLVVVGGAFGIMAHSWMVLNRYL